MLTMRRSNTTSWFDGYQPRGWDEVVSDGGAIRPHYQDIAHRLSDLNPADVERRHRLADLTMRQQGITFTVYGRDQGVERIMPFDPMPRVVPADEWERVERGLKQRIRALNLFVHDVYHDRKILKDKIIPAELVLGCTAYRREMVGIQVPGDIYIHICGTDLIRDPSGEYLVLEDNGRTPSGVSYVLKNRQVMKQAFAPIFGDYSIRPVDDYPARLLAMLRHVAPGGIEDPTIAVLTPGLYNSAYFEHSFLARQMGVELVEGRDLVVENGYVHARTTTGLKRIDVLYRRVDDQFLDPLVFKPDSILGVPLLGCYRGGRINLANGIG
ncbi:MAG: circularly permuted type 2 ATP-grasp protein, partial [Planctomycetota bacterium]